MQPTGVFRNLNSPVGRNKPIRAIARTGVSGKHFPNSPETPPRATRLDGLIPAYPYQKLCWLPSSSFPSHEAKASSSGFPNWSSRRYTQMSGDTVIPAGIAGIQKPWMAIPKLATSLTTRELPNDKHSHPCAL